MRIRPAMGMITDSETFLTRPNTPGEKFAGVVPTCVATSDTCWLTESNIPERLLMIPSMSSPLSQSAICVKIASKGKTYLLPKNGPGRNFPPGRFAPAVRNDQPNRPESRGTRVIPMRATPPPAISCFIPWDFAYV